MKSIDDFMRSQGTKTGPFKTCNHCSCQKRQGSVSANLTVEDTAQDTIHYHYSKMTSADGI